MLLIQVNTQGTKRSILNQTTNSQQRQTILTMIETETYRFTVSPWSQWSTQELRLISVMTQWTAQFSFPGLFVLPARKQTKHCITSFFQQPYEVDTTNHDSQFSGENTETWRCNGILPKDTRLTNRWPGPLSLHRRKPFHLIFFKYPTLWKLPTMSLWPY